MKQSEVQYKRKQWQENVFKVPLLICPVFQRPIYSKLNLEISKHIYLWRIKNARIVTSFFHDTDVS